MGRELACVGSERRGQSVNTRACADSSVDLVLQKVGAGSPRLLRVNTLVTFT